MTLALKEWPAAIQALNQGEMMIIIRKGGIQDKGAQFSLPSSRTLLFPSFEHQKDELLKVKPSNSRKIYEPGDLLTIQNWIAVTDSIEISTVDSIPALNPHHIWTEPFVYQRYQWKPERPLFCILCRTYRLNSPAHIPYEAHYGGCKSWIELKQDIPFDTSQPVLSNSDFIEQSRQIKAILRQQKAYSSSGCDGDYEL